MVYRRCMRDRRMSTRIRKFCSNIDHSRAAEGDFESHAIQILNVERIVRGHLIRSLVVPTTFDKQTNDGPEAICEAARASRPCKYKRPELTLDARMGID